MTSEPPRIEWAEETGSTNSDARDRAAAGERGPLWLAARRQNAGRGRRGRVWTGLDGNLFATGLYTLHGDPARAAELSFLAALAVADLCDSVTGDHARTRVKWPNDVLVDGRKTAGILLESGQAAGGGLAAITSLAIHGKPLGMVRTERTTVQPAALRYGSRCCGLHPPTVRRVTR